MLHELETDYLIVGAGAVGMAFADEIVRRSPKLTVVLVDRQAKPGGHWNHAYRFVRLHQPAAYYGVNSEVLGTGGADLASGPKILAYYERVVEKLCATGRVRFFPQSEYEGEGRFRSLVSDDLSYRVTVRRKTVDAAYSEITVPSTRPPAYEVADGVSLVPINGLSRIERPWQRYVVIGSGKTGMDAALYLLERGVQPERISWVVPNEAWLVNRDTIFPSTVARLTPTLLRIVAEAEDIGDFYRRLEAVGWCFRLDGAIEPTRYRCATVSPGELAELRRIRHVVRLGRVLRIEPSEIVFEQGSLPTGPDVLHVDCTADGLVQRPPRKVFDDRRITLQPLVQCQQIFSAALTARIELSRCDEARRNAMCAPVPHPIHPVDQITGGAVTFLNMDQWTFRYGWWLISSRLSIAAHMSFPRLLRIMLSVYRWRKRLHSNLARLQEEHEAGQAHAEPFESPTTPSRPSRKSHALLVLLLLVTSVG